LLQHLGRSRSASIRNSEIWGCTRRIETRRGPLDVPTATVRMWVANAWVTVEGELDAEVIYLTDDGREVARGAV
jgi:hypothetical protein